MFFTERITSPFVESKNFYLKSYQTLLTDATMNFFNSTKSLKFLQILFLTLKPAYNLNITGMCCTVFRSIIIL